MLLDKIFDFYMTMYCKIETTVTARTIAALTDTGSSESLPVFHRAKSVLFNCVLIQVTEQKERPSYYEKND